MLNFKHPGSLTESNVFPDSVSWIALKWQLSDISDRSKRVQELTYSKLSTLMPCTARQGHLAAYMIEAQDSKR